MKHRYIDIIILLALVTGGAFLSENCKSTRIVDEYRVDTFRTNHGGRGNLLEVSFLRGPSHNHPLMAMWVEDTTGNYIQTIYVAKSIAKGLFEYGDTSSGKWLPGSIRRPAALPVWAHSRGVREDDGLYVPKEETAVPDAYTGATPPSHFILHAKTDSLLPEQFYLYMEINQMWDWNSYWTNNKYPNDKEYKTSAQPALVYRVLITKGEDFKQAVPLDLIGHSHYSGINGRIYTDLSSITTAKAITESITARILE
ncbi:MAG: hypothetical protein PVF73_08350 [Bacteroidales bacterium]|jgi:hypothetical protein